jgi:hypothetical protein
MSIWHGLKTKICQFRFRQLVAVKVRDRLQANPYKTYGGQSGTGRGFSPITSDLTSMIAPLMPSIHYFTENLQPQ